VSDQVLADALATIVGREHVASSPAALATARVDGVTPRWLVCPGSVDEVSRLMKLAASERLAVAPRGSGSSLDLGMPPARLDIALDLSRLTSILEYVPADMVATVEAGIRLDVLARELGKHAQMLPLDPYGGSSRSVGGVLASGQSGPRRLRYGTGRDLLLGTRFVQADGTITWGGAKVVKSVTGYDVPKLLAGSLGTLGIIVEATLRLHPVSAASRSWLFAFSSRAGAAAFVAAVLASTLEPERMTWLNAVALTRVNQECAATSVAISVGSVAEAVGAQGTALSALASSGGGRVSELDEGFWTDLGGALAGPIVLKLASELGRLPFWAEQLEEACARRGLAPSLVGEAGNGVMRAALEGGVSAVEFDKEIVSPLRDELGAEGGSLVIERAPLELKRAVDVWGPIADPALALMRRLKLEFDPRGTLNPGRFVGGL
jgi:glycolate oxidase FAD binding subunit